MHKTKGGFMGTLYENIKQLCEKKGVTPSRVCVDLGFSKTIMSSLKSGRTSSLSTSKLQAIADYFGITIDELVGIKKNLLYSFNDAQTGVTIEIKGYDGAISEQERKVIEAYAEALNKMVENAKNG